MELDEVRHEALKAALQLKPYGGNYASAGLGSLTAHSVSSVLADAKQIEQYLRGTTKPNGTKKKK